MVVECRAVTAIFSSPSIQVLLHSCLPLQALLSRKNNNHASWLLVPSENLAGVQQTYMTLISRRSVGREGLGESLQQK